jgi:hypothetical protein
MPMSPSGDSDIFDPTEQAVGNHALGRSDGGPATWHGSPVGRDADTDADTHTNADTDADTHTDADIDADTHTDADTDADTHTDADTDEDVDISPWM